MGRNEEALGIKRKEELKRNKKEPPLHHDAVPTSLLTCGTVFPKQVAAELHAAFGTAMMESLAHAIILRVYVFAMG